MNEKKYNVYDGSVKLVSFVDLDVALCLIKGYASFYCNDSLKITVKEAKLPETTSE